ncbi:MAG: hypothetical protein KAS75_08075, partial [Planctomycetes bacterium]|nr:hypothetical protein [Planctomycetota bacterium]
LDPPAKPKPRSQVSRKPSAPRRPPKVKAKFDLVGTSYYSKRPEQSLALIDEPGKGFRWVAQSEKVGHLVFEQIKDGVVVVRDGQKTFELTATRPEKRSLVKGVSGKAVPKNISETPDQSQDSNATDDTTVGPPPAAIDEGTKALMDMFVSKIRATQGEAEANGVNIEQNAEMMKKLVSDLRAMRISTEESNKLGDLGEELKEIQQDPNQPGPGRLTSQIKIMDPEIMKRLAKRQRSMKIEKPSEPNSPKKK